VARAPGKANAKALLLRPAAARFLSLSLALSCSLLAVWLVLLASWGGSCSVGLLVSWGGGWLDGELPLSLLSLFVLGFRVMAG
jgi:hypothetical protein